MQSVYSVYSFCAGISNYRHTMQINIRHVLNGTGFNSERCHEYTTYISLTLLWCPEQLFPDMESSLVNTPQDLYGREGRGSSVNTTSMGRGGGEREKTFTLRKPAEHDHLHSTHAQGQRAMGRFLTRTIEHGSVLNNIKVLSYGMHHTPPVHSSKCQTAALLLRPTGMA